MTKYRLKVDDKIMTVIDPDDDVDFANKLRLHFGADRVKWIEKI